MILEFGFGKGVQKVDVPDKNLLAVLTANEMEHERRGADAVDYALAHPIGSAPLKEIAKKGQKVVVITSDISRPLPSYDVLPSVIRYYGCLCARFPQASHRRGEDAPGRLRDLPPGKVHRLRT